ncbi:hypothetical protein LCGC14_2040470 [marine sediment metagenome]|uniref:Uncharacterized protein n=1 Tax=marine sediment metagenome TaxID=412755 RepID=A0A0F9HP38_9ZZZZ
MARFRNRSTAVHDTITSEFRASVQKLPKKRVPGFGEELKDLRHNPIKQVLKDNGIKLRTLRKKVL